MAKIRPGREHQPHARRIMLAEAMGVDPESISLDDVRAGKPVNVPHETDEEIVAKLTERFEIIRDLTVGATTGETRACIISGPAGIGKSYTVEEVLRDWNPDNDCYSTIKGYVKATGLYKMLWSRREHGQVLVFDDADQIFFEDTALSLLKAVCDTTETRVVHYLAERGLVDEETGDKIPSAFEFNGTIIFITNIDFDTQIARNSKLTPHLEALMSRAHYVDLSMRTKRDYLVRIRQVIGYGMLQNRGLSDEGINDVVNYIENNYEKLRELSLRMAIKLSDIRKIKGRDWEGMARVTCCRA